MGEGFSIETIGVVVAASCVLVTCGLAALRVARGPSIIDRMIGSDVILAAVMCGLVAYMIVAESTALLPVILVISIFGIVGSVTVSRFVHRRGAEGAAPGAPDAEPAPGGEPGVAGPGEGAGR